MRGPIVLGILLASGAAWADVAPPPPDNCPEGYRPDSSHLGPYCEPPLPDNCPPGHTPRVVDHKAYCEPPPPKPCPAGSFWQANGPEVGNGNCETRREERGPPYIQIRSSLCTRMKTFRRGLQYEVVSGPCQTDADCPQGETCVLAKRYVTRAELKASRESKENATGPAAGSRRPDPAKVPASGPGDGGR
jgi:hypothetical protein